MELNFDKEMDALLRQAARSDKVVSIGAETHMDADEISAFAENALPERTRAVYMKHLADCDRCRKILSNLILLNAETESQTDASVVTVVPEVVAAKKPWYRRIFAVPNLAYTLGGLVILFGGFLGFLVFQSTNTSQNSEISQIAEEAPRASGPNVESGEAIYNSNAMNLANTANISANSAANTSITMSNMTTTNTSASTSTANAATTTAATPELLARESRDLQKQSTEEQTLAKIQPNDAKVKNEKDVTVADQSLAEDKESIRQAPAPAKPVQAAPPSDSAGRSELSTRMRAKKSVKEDNKTVTPSENTRQISGKTFNRRNGVWYDVAFSGQSTTNVRRNTESYRKLDKNLRIIAESLDGTVVVVWRERAYRIQ